MADVDMHVERIPEVVIPGQRLGRHIKHDPRSRRFAYRGDPTVVYRTVQHNRVIPVLDQGNLGSCTGNAAEGAIGTGALFAALPPNLRPSTTDAQADEQAAVRWYSRATVLDGYAGAYPPEDTGSDGLSVAKALKEAGLISGYLHAFTLEDALRAIMAGPVLSGFRWYSSFDRPDANGLIRITPDAYVRGGHEVVIDRIDAERRTVGSPNSWGLGYGKDGRFEMSWDTFGRLLSEDGDVTILVPITSPAPVPTPVPPEPRPFPLSFLVAWFRWLWRVLRGRG